MSNLETLLFFLEMKLDRSPVTERDDARANLLIRHNLIEIVVIDSQEMFRVTHTGERVIALLEEWLP